MKTRENSSESDKNKKTQGSGSVQGSGESNRMQEEKTGNLKMDRERLGKKGKLEDGTEGLDKENIGKGREFGMAADKKRPEGESKSIHVEDWENDPYAGGESDVRGELNVRAGGERKGEKEEDLGLGKDGKGGNLRGSGVTGSKDQKRGNEHRESGNDDTLGVP